MSQDLNLETDQYQDVWTGNLYYSLPSENDWKNKLQEGNRQKCERKFQAMKESNPENIDAGKTLDDVFAVLLPEGRQASFYVSRSSLDYQDTYECTIPKCPFGDNRSNCAMLHEHRPILLLRTPCDSPSLEAFFPGKKTLSLRVHLNECPQKGCVLEILDVIWTPKRDKMPFEEEIEVEVHRNSLGTPRQRNLFTTRFLKRLPVLSENTQKQMSEYDNYLIWSTRLSQAQKGGLRYTEYEVDPENKTVSFVVLSESLEKYKWQQIRKNAEDIEIIPLAASSDRWNFNLVEQNQRSHRKIWAIPLGECKNVNEIKSKNPTKMDECPWKNPFGTTITFELTEEQAEKLPNTHLFPEEGFLCKSTRGTETLNYRLRRGIDQMRKFGAEGAPWLAYYLNDIKNAQIPTPKEMAQPIEFFNKNLNEDQKRAVEVAVRAPEIALIQGPPGTGKTTVAGEITRQCVANHKRVLIVSQSSAAVDNMLDRLPLDPGLRVYRITSKGREQREKDEPSRYSKEKVAETFCKSLLTGPKQRLDNWKNLEEQNTQIHQLEERLQNIHSRIEIEEKRLHGAQEVRNRLQIELQQIENKQNENLLQNSIRESAERFIACLRQNRFSELEQGKPLSDFVYKEFEEIIQPALNEFQRVEIGFGTLYNSNWSNDRKTTSIIQKLRDFKDFQTRKIARIREDYAKLHALGTNEVILNENALKLHEIQKRLQELDAEFDQALEESPERIEEIEFEIRKLRKQKRALNQELGLSKDCYEDIFNLPQTSGNGGIAAYLTAPGLSRVELLSRFQNLLSLIDSLNKQTKMALAQFTASCEKYLAETPVLQTQEKEIARFRRQIGEQNEIISEINELWKTSLHPQEIEAVLALNKQFHLNIQNRAEALNWCRINREQNQARLQDSAGIRTALEPFLRDCVQILEVPELKDKEALQERYIQSCSIVGITCTANFRELESYGYFDVVIVDEVSKAMLPELLIPMLKAEKCILIGDHRQLPPLFNQQEPLAMTEIMQRDLEDDSIPPEVKISWESFPLYKKMVEASYFKQIFQDAPAELKASLFTQYRMHPEIMRIDNVFYDGMLKSGFTGPEDQIRPHHQANLPGNHHVYWIDSTKAPDGYFFREQQSGTSKTNPLEVALIVKTMQDLDAGLEGTGLKKTVGIISFYFHQKKLLRRELRRCQFRNLTYKVETVDRFQGQEKDYILVSMTRNVQCKHRHRRNPSAYVAQFERINVAFSRARELLMVFGAAQMFRDYEINLESLIRPGESINQKVYGQIICLLQNQGCFLKSEDIISASQWSMIRPYGNR